MLIGAMRLCEARMKETENLRVYTSGGWYVFYAVSFQLAQEFRFQISEGQARPLIQKYNVKKRSYYGNTSMDAEVSLLMANQTLVRSSIQIDDVKSLTCSDLFISGIARQIHLRPICWHRQHGIRAPFLRLLSLIALTVQLCLM